MPTPGQEPPRGGATGPVARTDERERVADETRERLEDLTRRVVEAQAERAQAERAAAGRDDEEG